MTPGKGPLGGGGHGKPGALPGLSGPSPVPQGPQPPGATLVYLARMEGEVGLGQEQLVKASGFQLCLGPAAGEGSLCREVKAHEATDACFTLLRYEGD